MDFRILIVLVLLGIVVGLMVLSRFLRWNRQRQEANREAGRRALDDNKERFDLNQGLTYRIDEADSFRELGVLEEKIISQKNKLFADDYANLVERAKVRREQLAAEDAEHEARFKELEPELAQFRALRDIVDPEARFKEMHRLLVTSENALLDEYVVGREGWTDEDQELADQYDGLLNEYLRHLLSIAKSDTSEAFAAWEELQQLRQELTEAFEDFSSMIEDDVLAEWWEVTVRFVCYPAWEDFVGDDKLYRSIDADRLKEIVRGAEKGDLLEMQLARLLLIDDDYDLNQVIVNQWTNRMNALLEAAHSSLNFVGVTRQEPVNPEE